MPRHKRHPKPSPEARAGRAIRHAAGIIRDKGWVKGSMGSPETGFCVLGAIEWGIKDSKLQRSTQVIFSGWLRQQFNTIASDDNYDIVSDLGGDVIMVVADYTSIIGSFNDRLSPDKDHVLATMLRFADEKDPQSAS